MLHILVYQFGEHSGRACYFLMINFPRPKLTEICRFAEIFGSVNPFALEA